MAWNDDRIILAYDDKNMVENIKLGQPVIGKVAIMIDRCLPLLLFHFVVRSKVNKFERRLKKIRCHEFNFWHKKDSSGLNHEVSYILDGQIEYQ